MHYKHLPVIAVNGIVGAQVSPLDRGFAYGDGVFETCRMINSKIPLWNFHQDRLVRSCGRLSIPIDIEKINQQFLQLIQVVSPHELNDAIVKITVTRGEGGRGYNPEGLLNPTVVISIFPGNKYPEHYYTNGVAIKICNQKLSCNKTLAGLKHLNRLEQILARSEWQDNSVAEGLMFDTNNHLIEAVFSNIFIVKHNKLFTPDLSVAGVAGVMRRFILDEIRVSANIDVEINVLSLNDLLNADEIFLCNSLYGIWPVNRISMTPDYTYAVGPVTLALQSELHKQLPQFLQIY